MWANGVLASTAVGVALDFLTGWNLLATPAPRLQYFGNACLIEPYELKLGAACRHYPCTEVGDP